MASQPSIQIQIGIRKQITEAEIFELKRQEMGANGMSQRGMKVEYLKRKELLVIAREVIEMSHGVELESKVENESPDVVVSEAKLAKRRSIRVVVQGIKVSESERNVIDTERLVEEMGSASANSSGDMVNGNGAGLKEVAENGGGDDFGVHVKVGE